MVFGDVTTYSMMESSGNFPINLILRELSNKPHIEISPFYGQ
jgi:hypothetical protein